jgi:hypothetical protein
MASSAHPKLPAKVEWQAGKTCVFALTEARFAPELASIRRCSRGLRRGASIISARESRARVDSLGSGNQRAAVKSGDGGLTLGPNLGRNDPCHCGSGKKYKQCHLGADEAKSREERAKAAEEAPAPEAAAAPAPSTSGPKHQTRQPWKKAATNTHGFGKTSLPRKVGGS